MMVDPNEQVFELAPCLALAVCPAEQRINPGQRSESSCLASPLRARNRQLFSGGISWKKSPALASRL